MPTGLGGRYVKLVQKDQYKNYPSFALKIKLFSAMAFLPLYDFKLLPDDEAIATVKAPTSVFKEGGENNEEDLNLYSQLKCGAYESVL